MSGKRELSGTDTVQTLRRRIDELERWFERQDRQIRFLERERQKLSALVNHTDAGVLVFGLDHSVRWLNTVCRTWFGDRARAGSVGAAACNELLCGSDRVCGECPVAGALATATVSHREMRLDLGAVSRHIYATAMPIKTPDNCVDECILMLQDITDLEVLRKSERDLVHAKNLAESANRIKSEFLANVSHEVRTPMTGIPSMSSHLEDTPLTDEQRECVEIIQSAAQSLLAIINDILDSSRIEAGRLSIEPYPFDLVAMAEEVIDLVAPRAAEKGIELILQVAGSIPDRVVGDGGRIRQALLNLVGNAIKFTHEGHVLVGVERLAAGDDPARPCVRLFVEDTGIGIPADMLGSVFEKFTQADGSITRQYGGTGLGLSISKELVELMGGEIAVASRPGAGSTFSFTLVLPADCGETSAPQQASSLEGLRVLLLHRSREAAAVLAAQLRGWGADVQTSHDAQSALAALRAAQGTGHAFHAAILDHALEGSDGDLVSAIRGDAALAALSLVLLAAPGRRADAAANAARYDALLRRPPRLSQLHAVLAATLPSPVGASTASPAVGS